MSNDYYIEVGSAQRNHDKERICGDYFICEKIQDEQRAIMVLTDGMGHGIKANILATLTAKMALSFSKDNKASEEIAETILRTLPICQERKISYATFTIVDIQIGGLTRILEYGNPETLIFRGSKLLDPHWQTIYTHSKLVRKEDLKYCEFEHHLHDRIISVSDGVTQSGMGMPNFLLGWGRDGVERYLQEMFKHDSNVGASTLAHRLINRAHQNDQYKAKDDTSASVIYLRTPRKMLLFTGPPFERERDAEIAQMVKNFKGCKAVSGASTAQLLAREWDEPMLDDPQYYPGSIPPSASIEGIDLCTEGVVTLNAVAELLHEEPARISEFPNPAERLFRMLLEHDEITIIMGNQLNLAHFNPNNLHNLPLRQTVVKKIVQILEQRYLKDIKILYC